MVSRLNVVILLLATAAVAGSSSQLSNNDTPKQRVQVEENGEQVCQYPGTCLQITDQFGLGRRFDGIGGLSGGGATSKLLVNYVEPQRKDILDILFKPNYLASLQTLKVEIGGDDQSTDGGELSHQHTQDDLNFHRGYEWWLLKEAKKRNPNIQTYALSWAFPGWVGEGTQNPYHNKNKMAQYVVSWLIGARLVHNLTIDYIGVWNERPADLDYIVLLRNILDANNFKDVKIISNDGLMFDWTYNRYMKNATLAKAVWGFGVHYPGTHIAPAGISSGKPLWASEDYSTFNDDVGAGCWARILNQNYVNGYMTSTISWNLIASYYNGLPFQGDGLMTAVEPWSGHYEVKGPIFISAHTTLFTSAGWTYLKHGYGVGHLPKNGSIVALTDPSKKELTIIIETMSHDHSVCIRPNLPAYTIEPQRVGFELGGSFKQFGNRRAGHALYLWKSTLRYGANANSTWLQYIGEVPVTGSTFVLELDVDSVYTVSTVKQAHPIQPKGRNPPSAPFPLPYRDNFERQDVNQDPYLLTAQTGQWEILAATDANNKNNQFARQIVPERPVAWCGHYRRKPIAVIGDTSWRDVSVSARVLVPRNSKCGVDSVFVATRSNATGCASEDAGTRGVYAWFYPGTDNVTVTADFAGQNVLGSATVKGGFLYDHWYTIGVSTKGSTVDVYFDKTKAITIDGGRQIDFAGFVGIGSNGFAYSDWDDLHIDPA